MEQPTIVQIQGETPEYTSAPHNTATFQPSNENNETAVPDSVPQPTSQPTPQPNPQTTPQTEKEPSRSSATKWLHLSSTRGDIAAPSNSTQQTASLILDIDQDGVNDFVIGIRQSPGPSMVWYQYRKSGWEKHIIDDAVLDIEAGGTYYDIDQDGDLDIVMAGDYQSNKVWWWENPYPNFDPTQNWTRREIKNSGSNKHHDQMFGDFDGDGQAELVFWNQGASTLFLADIPPDPKTDQPWAYHAIYTWRGGKEHEGLAQADIDGDGQVDIIGGGRWFKHTGELNFEPNIINDDLRFSRVAAGQLKAGGRPEVVFVAGDEAGPLLWYEWVDNTWVAHDPLETIVDHGHSLDIADLNGDGNLDIFFAEMRLNNENPDSKMMILLGDGQGTFSQTVIANGIGNHESRVGDLDGDGDLDILGKPYNWETPRLDIWLNTPLTIGSWQRMVIDSERSWQATFIYAEDLDGDNFKDITAGGWWYKNPGTSGGDWARREVGTPFNNVAAVYDFDGDGDFDLLGTEGKGSETNSKLVWARNDGNGQFTVLNNIAPGDGDFLQGAAVGQFHGDELSVMLSWHQAGKGIQQIVVPPDPSKDTWAWKKISDVSQDEAISAGDIDNDGDLDLLLGTQWLRNDTTTWTPFTLYEPVGLPDRNRLADINGDGLLDAVIGYEAISENGKLAWYTPDGPVTDLWVEHIIADPAIIGPMSLDVVDFDQDGDLDVVVGEHNTAQPSEANLYIFENADGLGENWNRHLVYKGDEHHDGAQAVDIDNDTDIDIVSLGWTNSSVMLYENLNILRSKGEAVTNQPEVESPGTSVQPATVTGPIVLYNFQEGQGTIIQDQSGVEPGLDLTLPTSGTSWITGGGISIDQPSLITSQQAAVKIAQAAQAAGEITIELWVKPASLNQSGPARIVSLSSDQNHRNFTVGQGLWGDQPTDLYDFRIRTSGTDLNGQPSISTREGALQTSRTHIVFTYSANGERTIFIDGEKAASAMSEGNLSNWSTDYRLAIGNEMDGSRPWLGEVYWLAIYARALGMDEVQQNYLEQQNR